MKKNALSLAIATILFTSCGGGGGSNSFGTGGEASGGPGGGSSGATNGLILHVQAAVKSDTCGERIAPVDQQFVVGDGVIDTLLTSMPANFSGGSSTGSFTESNGDCTRTYTVQIDGYTSNSPHFVLTSQSTCGTRTCQSVWEGTGAEEFTLRDVEVDGDFRVNGERCNANVPTTVGYRPSSFECNGNAAVLLSGNQRNNYSVVVRVNGQYNDRDPKNPSCGTNRCSPYKTQKKIELPEYQINCLGASGFSAYYDAVQRISIKYVALVTNPSDTRQFEQYCLNNVEANLH